MNETIPDFPVRYRLRRAMEFGDLEPEMLADKLGVHINTVANYLAGRTKPRRATLMVVADLTGVPLWWLEGTEPTEGDTQALIGRYQMQLFAAA